MNKVIKATVDAILKEDLSEESAIQCSVYAGAVADVTMQALEEGLAAATVETVHAAIEASESKKTLEGEDVRQKTTLTSISLGRVCWAHVTERGGVLPSGRAGKRTRTGRQQ